ncbi:MAG: hypothetical protein QY309_06020 [Cyclobacteriaceae bacterium]|nr:MAG: hypothetical protein QY309_06020 [Cyclobacteriaceae bacterium]
MTRIILTVFLIATISCGNRDSESETIKPKWTTGDYRFFNEQGSIFVRTDSDTIINTEYEKKLKVTVVEKVGQDYIVEIALQPLGDLSITTTVDSLRDLSSRMNNVFEITKDLVKFNIPYKVKISENGKLIDIIDFDNHFEKYMDTFLSTRDSIKISDKESEDFKRITRNNGIIADQLQAAIVKEASELLAIYNIKNPVNGDIVEETTMPNPKTGEIFPTTLTYHSKSFSGDIQEIELNIKFEKSLNDILADSTATMEKFNYDDMINLTTYILNHKTGWLESSKSTVDYKSDKFEMKMRTFVKVSE